MSEVENEELEPLEEQEPVEEPSEEDAEDEEAPAAEPSPEEAGPQAGPPQDEDRVKLAKSLSTRYDSYKKSMIDRLGDEAPEWMVCPLCTSSMAPGFVNVHDFGNVPDDIRANVDTYFGLKREKSYKQNPNTRTCPICDGETIVESGANAGEYITMSCPECKGYGYVPPPGVHPVGNGHAGSPEDHVAAALADLDTPERDNWGEPRVLPDGTLNSNFGKMPQFKSVHPTYGVTANLSAEELALS